MEAVSDFLNRDELERRRLEAAKDLLRGLTQSSVARKFGVSRTTASRWNRALRQKGIGSLRKRRATGRPSRLSREQLLLIPDIFAQGAVVHGFPDNRWTTARLVIVIEDRCGVRYNHDHVGKLMQQLGLSGFIWSTAREVALLFLWRRGQTPAQAALKAALQELGALDLPPEEVRV